MKCTLRIIINRYFNDENTRCSSNEVGVKLPLSAMLPTAHSPRILGLPRTKRLNFVSNFEGHSLSTNTLYSKQESAADKVTGVVAFVCLLALAFFALGV